MRTDIKTALGALAVLIALGQPVQADDGAAQLRAALQEAYPATTFGEVRPSVIAGLYEVELGRNLAYIEPQGRYFFFGHIYDMQRQVDLTADRLTERDEAAQAFALDALPASDTLLIRAAASGQPTVTVFSDPLCGFCKALEQTLVLAPEIGVRIAPLAFQPGSDAVTRRIWCAADPGAAWRDYMLEGTPPPLAGADCDSGVIERNAQLAKRAGISGTPTIIAPDGRMQAGALELAALRNWLSPTTAVLTDIQEPSQ